MKPSSVELSMSAKHVCKRFSPGLPSKGEKAGALVHLIIN